MAFKLIKQEKRPNNPSGIDNTTFMTLLLEDHNNKLSTRSKNIDLVDNSIPSDNFESKKEFDFFWDEKKEAARKDAIYDLENSIIERPVIQNEEQVVDRRKSKRK